MMPSMLLSVALLSQTVAARRLWPASSHGPSREPTREHVSCSLIGGLLSADLPATCCFTAQVVTQRGLVGYGLAQACMATWECGPDHQTPTKQFEERSLRDMCAEQGCVEMVTAAMRANWMTSRGADRMADACAGPAASAAGVPGAPPLAVSAHALPAPQSPQTSKSMRGSRAPERAFPRREPLTRLAHEANSSFAVEAGAPPWGAGVALHALNRTGQGHVDKGDGRAGVTALHAVRHPHDEDGGDGHRRGASSRFCQRRVCQNATAFQHVCKRPGEPDHACYQICCQQSDFVVCFPGEAEAQVEGRGPTPVAELRPADRVLVERTPGGPLVYEPVLGFAHARRGGSKPHQFLVVTHSRGEFRASDGHIVFAVGSDGQRVDKPLGRVELGERLFVAGTDGAAELSEVLSMRRGTGRLGMFAPLTSSGSIVVDGVVASNYGWPAANIRLPHWLAHASLSPVRAYHRLGLGQLLAPAWRRLCGGGEALSGKLRWPCGGGGLAHLEPSRDRGVDELHPFLDIIMRARLEKLLPVV